MESRIKQLREKRGIIQETLAAELGITQQTLSKYERDITFIKVDILKKIADADRRNQNGQRRSITKRFIRDFFNQNTQQRTNENTDKNRNRCVQPRISREKTGRSRCPESKRPDHNNIAVREIQHPGNAVNHGISKRNQSINTAETDAAQ